MTLVHDPATRIGIRRHFTTPDVHPYDMVTWVRRDAQIKNYRDGSVAFEQLDVEFPETWSLNAVNIVAQKYFRGTPGTPQRETSLRQVIDRIVDDYTESGIRNGYFADDEEAETFRAELKYVMVTQRESFNSPVWFNVGVPGTPRQISACFILNVQDTMHSILNWYVEEGKIFQGGSGAGVNLSAIRSSYEYLKGGGTASGPVSFMRGADASAGTIKSGGKTRRAAKMVILNADHPDIEDFIWCKAIEERKARVLRDAGFDMDLDGKDSHSTQYQNANNSVRVTDEFMQAVVDDADWHLRAVKTGEPLRTVKARHLFRQMMEATHQCADPGMQFDTTINRWHTLPGVGPINGSNPCCFTGETLIETDRGLMRFDLLCKEALAGLELPRVVSLDPNASTGAELRRVVRVWKAGETTRLICVQTERGQTLRCTPEHRFLTVAGTFVEAQALRPGTVLRSVRSGGPGSDLVAAEDVVKAVQPIACDGPEAVYDMEVEGTHTFAVCADSGPDSEAIVVHNSEYMSIDNSSCNLASINLLHFLREDGSFDIEAFRHVVSITFTAMDISICDADFPTEAIAENTRRYRQLGLGYANVGALLMALGLAYDSEEGRTVAASITALMCGEAYATSGRIAARVGPFHDWDLHAGSTNNVLRMHRAEVDKINIGTLPPRLRHGWAAVSDAATTAWDDAIGLGETVGIRNSQATLLAPTGCLTPDTLVPTERGLVRIGGLGNPGGDQWQDLDVDVASDGDAQRATKFFVNGVVPVARLVTKNGYALAGTPQHRIKVVDEATGEFVWSRLGDTQPGTLVPLAMNNLVGTPNEIRLPSLGDAHWLSDFDTRTPELVTPALAELVGYFMGDGSLHPKGLRFSVTGGDFDVAEHLLGLAKECFGLLGTAVPTPQEKMIDVCITSVRLSMWWEACGFAKHAPSEGHRGKGYDPHIPNAILHTNDPEIYAAFLRGLYEADGSVTHGAASLGSTTPSLLSDCQTMLLALGIPTTRRVSRKAGAPGSYGKKDLETIRVINRQTMQAWGERIGFIGSRKSGGLRAAEGHQSARGDHLPVSPALLTELRREAPSVDAHTFWNMAKRHRVAREDALRLIDLTGNAELVRLVGYYYEPIESVTLAEEEMTVDLSVPANLTYVANGFISHNTIGLQMDCDTTGIEPDLSLVKTKKLVGGGTMEIVNQTVPRALRGLGYSPKQIEEIQAYIAEHKSIMGAPHLSADHLPVFACSMGDNTIAPLGHVRMMAAVQPWLSGAISKTANVPENATVEDMWRLHIDAWRMGLKSLAVYRDNCKVAQPLSTTKAAPATVDAAASAAPVAVVATRTPERERLPRMRDSKTFSFRVADCHGYVTVGQYDDGRPGEIFMRVAKQGSTLAGIMDAFAISVSHGLQYGVPLKAFVDMYTNMRFEPAGITDDAEIRFASSLVDYIFRRLAVEYLTAEERADLGILTVEERMQPTLPGVEEATTISETGMDLVRDTIPASATVAAPTISANLAAPAPSIAPNSTGNSDAPYCYQCGVIMQRAGACFVCSGCGTTSGCS